MTAAVASSQRKPKKCVCGAEFDEKKDFYKHMHHMRCNEANKPLKPAKKYLPKQLDLFGGR